MVMGFKRDYFSTEILPELARLSKKNVIRVIDLLFVMRDSESVVTSQELAQLLPDHAGLISNPPEMVTEWFTQDDIDAVGESLPDNASVALLLFEHRWAARLDEAVQQANTSLVEKDGKSPVQVIEIEQFLAAAAGATAAG
jgi:hypothetical protein